MDSTGTAPLESVPTAWEDTRDGSFFRVAAHLLDPAWVEGASGLLAANDPD